MITTILIGVGIVFGLISLAMFLDAKLGSVKAEGWCILCIMIGAFTIPLTIAKCIADWTEIAYQKPNIISYELISLENKVENVATLNGSGSFLGHSIHGEMKGVSICTFIIKKENGDIVIQNIPAESMTFREGEPRVDMVEKSFTYPNRCDNTSTFCHDDETTWVVYIPTSSINRYIKFN